MSPTSGDCGPREGLRRRRSEDRLRTPLAWPWLSGLSSLWKTLRSVALQGRAPIDANTGVLGGRQGGARNRKRAESQPQQGMGIEVQRAHPPAGRQPSRGLPFASSLAACRTVRADQQAVPSACGECRIAEAPLLPQRLGEAEAPAATAHTSWLPRSGRCRAPLLPASEWTPETAGGYLP